MQHINGAYTTYFNIKRKRAGHLFQGRYKSIIVDSQMRADDKLARNIMIHLCHKYSGKKLKEIGTYFGIGESGVSQTSLRAKERSKRD